MKKNSILFAALVLITFPVLQSEGAIAGDFEVIVNSSVKDQSLTKDEIKQIFLTNKLVWSDKSDIKIVAMSPDAPQADDVDKEYMGMTALQAKKFWLTKVFNNVLHGQPPLADTADEVAEKVASTPGAIAAVPKGTKLGSAKVLEEK